MRIVIEIDHPAVIPEADSQLQAPIVYVVGAAAPESAAPTGPVVKPAATTGAEDPMSMNAGGAYSIEVAEGAANVPPELLARAASLSALSAGPPVPGFTADAPARTSVTQEDSSESLLTHAGEDSFIPACSLEAVHDGGITSAGPAPK
jgi:hypothetical protein